MGEAIWMIGDRDAARRVREVWQIANLTGDTHPIHFHLVNVQILSRQPFDTYANGAPVVSVRRVDPSRPSWAGRKQSRCTQ